MVGREDSRRAMEQARDSAQWRPVDIWIAADLAARYDPTLAEPLPPELLALLRD